MLCPKCGFEQADEARECRKCGVIIAKVHAHPPSSPVVPAAAIPAQQRDEEQAEGFFATVKELVLPTPKDVNHIIFAGRVVVFIGLVVWGYRFITNTWQSTYVMESFMHNINLPFHEAGHLIFSPFGRFMQVLGGSLMQLLMPLICLGAFLYPNRNPFAASVALWWFAQSLMDLAPYIGDARAGELRCSAGSRAPKWRTFTTGKSC